MSDRTAAGVVLECHNLGKTFQQGSTPVHVLAGVNLSVATGETIAIIGASGSGKSTLLHLLGGLDQPSEGRVLLQGHDLSQVSESKSGELRNRSLGFVYQFHHLLAEFSALENVAMPLFIRRDDPAQALGRAEELLKQVGLGHRLTHHPSALSGGERQRVAVARALVTAPAALLADEPTGNLDRASADAVFALMLELCRTQGTALITVTHDAEIAARMGRVMTLREGCLG